MTRPPLIPSTVEPFFGSLEVHTYTYPNGLVLKVVPDRSAPVVAYQTWYGVGSAAEVSGKTGLAHLFEHMMFKGTRGYADGEYMRRLEAMGVEGLNAWTWMDQTVYVQAVPANQLEALATLEAMRSRRNVAAADMGDVEIKRATLLDRALADLSFDKAKRGADLVNLERRYTGDSPAIQQKRHEISVIDQAIAARREQIAVLGRTGALTDAERSDKEETTVEIEGLLDKVKEQIETVRADAKALNGKRIRLDFLEEERRETRRMLDETRRALDVIRLESRNALPGLIDKRNPHALNPVEVEYGYWNDPNNARYHILLALDAVPGFERARIDKDIALMSELYRRYVIGYKPKNPERYTQNGQQAFFYEVGGLSGLMHRERQFLSKTSSPASLVKFVLPDLIDDDNPDALCRSEVEVRSK